MKRINDIWAGIREHGLETKVNIVIVSKDDIKKTMTLYKHSGYTSLCVCMCV